MGNSANAGNSSGNNPGLNQRCYQLGYDHTRNKTNPDPVGEGIDAFPCTLNNEANKAYGQGVVDGMNAGKSSGSAYTDNRNNLIREMEKHHSQSRKNPNHR